MPPTVTHNRNGASAVVDHFNSSADVWDEIYAKEGLPGVWATVYRDRHAAVLKQVERLSLPAGAHILEVGCGAGYLASDLARANFRVQAVDNSPAMIERARKRLGQGIEDGNPLFSVADATSLPFPDDTFDLVVAVGVLPWAPDPGAVVAEMSRVARPGARVIVTTANRLGLPYLLDPSLNPLLRPLSRAISAWLAARRKRPHPPKMTWHWRRTIDHMLSNAGLVPEFRETIGFGPFSFLGHFIRPEPAATRLHRRLQSLADRRVPLVRSLGMSYHVVSLKQPVSRPS